MTKIGLLGMEVVGGLIWLGLAVWGAGGIAVFFAEPARAALVAATVALTGAGFFSQANLNRGQKEDRANRWVLFVLFPLGFLNAWLPAYSERIGFFVFGGAALSWLGAAMFFLGGCLRIWPVFVLGPRFSGLVAIQEGHTLETGGIYKRLRNPSYLGLLVMVLGWALTFRSGLGVLIALIYVPVLLGRIRSEEAMLAGHFGAAYDAYRAKSWRLIPYLY